MFSKIYLVVFLFCFSFQFFVGQENQLKPKPLQDILNFHLLDVSSGLSNNFVNDIKQDSLGFIWIATTDGLNRYDGSSFLNFKKSFDTSAIGLVNNYVQQLEFYSSHELLIATDEGLNIYDYRDDKFIILDHEQGLLNNSVSSITVDSQGNPIIGTYRGGVQFADENWKFMSLQEKAGNVTALSSNEISSMAVQGDSVLWVGTFSHGLNKISLKSDKVTRLFDNESNFPLRNINNLFTDSHKNLWIGTRKGLQVITREGDTLQLSKSGSALTGLSDDDVLCFEEDENGQMWIGTRNGGLNIVDISSLLNKEKLPSITWYLPRTDGLSVYNRTISAIMRDEENSMWLGTPTGINYVNPQGEPVKLLKRNYTSKESISHDRISALAGSDQNKVWIGTDGGGLDLFDPESGIFNHFNHQDENKKSLSNNYILSVLEDSKDRVWVGTYQGGLNRLNKETGNSQHYLQGPTAEGSDVRKIFEDGNEEIWVGTNRGGLYRYNELKDRFEYIESLGKLDIRDIDQDQKGNLWLATFGSGILKYNPSTDLFTEFNKVNTNDLSSNIVFCLKVLENGDILAGTRYGGLVRLNPEEKKLQSFTEKDGLSNNSVSSLVKENENYIWIGTYKGISRYNIHTNEIQDITSVNNIQTGEFNNGAAFRDASGKLYFGGNNGLNILNPENINNLHKHHALIFHGLKVLNEPVTVKRGRKGEILEKSLPFQDRIELKHNQNSFSIDFSALKYPEARNLTYSYKLENYNDFWIETQGAGIANFTSVPPGNYNLVVKTTSALGDESFQNLFITIAPPFWKTIPAYVLYSMVILLITWLVLRYYSERIHLKNSLLFEKKQRQLEHDLNEERMRFFTAFSHELKTPLTLILAPLENLLSQKMNREIKRNLLFIERNAQNLFSTINRLLEFRKSQEELSHLNLSKHDLQKNLRKWIENYLQLAKDKNISLDYSLPAGEKFYWIDLEKIEVIVNNLLSNAIKYGESGGAVKVSFMDDQKNFKIEVSNTGTGIKPEELSQIFNWYYRSNSAIRKSGTGIGLALSKNFAELHGGKIEARSIPGKETIFTVCIPVVEKKAEASIVQEPVQKESFFGESEARLPTKSKYPKASITSEANRKLILIIDDNSEILDFLKGIFRDEFDILYSTNGKDGILKASKYVPDLIISDVMMPEKSGMELCAELKRQYSTSHIPIILLTAKTNLESINKGFEEGADDYITKPFHPKLLKTRVKNLLENRRQLQQYFEGIDEPDTLPGNSGLLDQEKKFLADLDQIIQKHISKGNDNVELVAQEIGMSRTSLYRKLKAITGKNINEYIRNLKIKIAAELLQNEEITVSQASYEVGFNNLKYFRKIFKEKYGKSPSEFKKIKKESL